MASAQTFFSVFSTEFAWIVEWDNGHTNGYRMKNGVYDLTLAECYGL